MGNENVDSKNEENRVLFSNKLVRAMEYRKCHNQELADATGLSLHSVSLYRRKKSFYTCSFLKDTAEYLRLKYEYFFDINMTEEEADLDIEIKVQTQFDIAVKKSLFDNPNELNGLKKEFAELIISTDDMDTLKVMYDMAKQVSNLKNNK